MALKTIITLLSKKIHKGFVFRVREHFGLLGDF